MAIATGTWLAAVSFRNSNHTMRLAPIAQKLATFDPDISEVVLHMTSCVAYHVAPIGLRPTMLNMIAAKCVHYEKCITQMDFQYHPNGWKSSNCAQPSTQKCSF